jgi:Ca2+-binding RTX toxin-like protein
MAVALAVPAGASAAAGDILVGSFGGTVTRISPDGSSSEVIAEGAQLGGAYGLDFGPDAPYLADSNGPNSAVYRIVKGSLTPHLIVSGAPFNNPLDLEFGPDGAAYVAEDSLGVLRVRVGAGSIGGYATGSIFDVAYALTVAPDMTVYVSDDDDVLAVDPSTHAVTVAATIPDSPLPGVPSLTGIERAPSGLLYAFDVGEQRLVRINPATHAVRTVASGTNLTGGNVYNIAIEPAGTLVLDNYSISRIVRVNPTTGAQTLVPGTVEDTEGIAVEPPRCRGRLATIVGSTKADVIRGSRFGDVIATLAGKDKVLGLGGRDIICGGAGPDRLLGGGGRDVLLGGPGPDRLAGGKGRDKLRGGPGRDRQRQ